MLRTHCSKEPVLVLRNVPPDTTVGTSYKPHGLWYSCDGEWERWCEDEDWERGDFIYSVDISHVNLKSITNLKEFDAFHRDYIEPLPEYDKRAAWSLLAYEGYDGIEIAPYIHERRFMMDSIWYYTWDVASGCVWNASRLLLVQVK